MFNDLTGSNQYGGNWPGVTVEKKEGHLKGAADVVIQDLPGIYSLSPYTLEEVVARGYLVSERPDAILNIVDATNIERNKMCIRDRRAGLRLGSGNKCGHALCGMSAVSYTHLAPSSRAQAGGRRWSSSR